MQHKRLTTTILVASLVVVVSLVAVPTTATTTNASTPPNGTATATPSPTPNPEVAGLTDREARSLVLDTPATEASVLDLRRVAAWTRERADTLSETRKVVWRVWLRRGAEARGISITVDAVDLDMSTATATPSPTPTQNTSTPTNASTTPTPTPTQNTSTPTNASTTPTPTPTQNTSTPTPAEVAGLTASEVVDLVESVAPSDVDRERVRQVARWARERAGRLDASQRRTLRLWLVQAAEETDVKVTVDSLSISVDGRGTATATPTPTPTNRNATGPRFGVIAADTGAESRPEQVQQVIVDGVYVTEVNWHPSNGTADLGVVVTLNSITLSSTDSNSIESTGSGKVAAELFTLPSGRFSVRVPASTREGSQTVVVGPSVTQSYYFSNDVAAGGGRGPLGRVDRWTPWIFGSATMLQWVVVAGWVRLKVEDSGVRKAGRLTR